MPGVVGEQAAQRVVEQFLFGGQFEVHHFAPGEVEAEAGDEVELHLVGAGGDHRRGAGDHLPVGFGAAGERLVAEHLLARPADLAFHRSGDRPRHRGERPRAVRVADSLADGDVVQRAGGLGPGVGEADRLGEPLVTVDVDAELAGIGDGVVEHQFGVGVAGDADALVGEHVAHDAPALVLVAEPVGHRHHHVGEVDLVDEVVGVRVGDLADLDARRVHRHEEDRDALALGRLGVGAHEQEAPLGGVGVRRPDLLAVHDVAVAVANGAGAQRGEVGAGVGLGEALAPVDLAGDDRRQVQRLLLGRAVGHERRADPVGVHVLAAAWLADAPGLLADDQLLPRRRLAPAVRLRPVRREEPVVAERGAERLHRVDVGRLGHVAVVERPPRPDVRVDRRPQRRPERPLVIGPIEIHAP